MHELFCTVFGLLHVLYRDYVSSEANILFPYRNTHLCPDLQNVLESHASVRKLALEQHDDVMIVLL